MKLIFKIAAGLIAGEFLYESSLLYPLSDDIREWKLEKLRAFAKNIKKINKTLNGEKNEKDKKDTLYGKSEIGFKM